MTATRTGDGAPRLQPVTPGAPALPGRPWIEQAWRDVVFVHWRVDVSAVAPLLPAGTRPDTIAPDGTDDGVTTWVGLIAFSFEDTRFPPFGPLGRTGSVGDFLEVNVRVYTRDDTGRRGVVFLSLDAGRFLPAVAARLVTGTPYHWARVARRHDGDRMAYAVRRHGTHLRSVLDVEVGAPVAEPTAVESFLTARWGMHVGRAGRTSWWPNEHDPWVLHRATLRSVRDDLVGAAGLPLALTELEPDSVLYSPGVVTRFAGPRA
ncbi:YqjF family protein [Curtobacterium aetherium]|uniref:DUF2071 domain-containing protein n=1 Tax=Curtobacterium aetherium TaxID=2841594 RepID=A0ACD1E315_9MICO|nr:DUF2071 domain-containing protein [Curtobacterium sp. L6-1]QWS33106.1 DUF2071 domain-containing protein [Curtobacterium sp. L6-1]